MSNELDDEPLVFKTVTQYLNEINYEVDPSYIPSEFALEFVNFIKLVDGGESENKTPVVHYHMIDEFVADDGEGLDLINMCHRGIAKSTLKEYLILYIGVYGRLPIFGKVPYALYVSDSIENGVKKMRKALEYRWYNSEFLQEYLPVGGGTKFTDVRWEFVNKRGNSFVVSGYGAKTGIRGTRENGSRPVLALLDDLISDEDARSPTVIASVEDTVTKALEFALHPTRSKVIWSGTPFNARDPLYKAVESGAWRVNVYPVCEKFPCSREEFRGSWEDRFDYDYVLRKYTKALRQGKVASFNQELMLRIMSDEDRLIQDSDISWYNRRNLIKNRHLFNFYITTDFATSEKTAADYSVISVWALNNKGDWFWVDGIVKKQLMDKNIDDLFRLAQMYKPMGVGIEVSGQQGGFIPWITDKMMEKNVYFNLASDNNGKKPGIRPSTDKITRFNLMVPMFKTHQMWFPQELEYDPRIIEFIEELSLVTPAEFKSKHDDCCDTISMLASLTTFKPAEAEIEHMTDPLWAEETREVTSDLDSYLV
jgi:predicted phage terminase large subunit-like protein